MQPRVVVEFPDRSPFDVLPWAFRLGVYRMELPLAQFLPISL